MYPTAGGQGPATRWRPVRVVSALLLATSLGAALPPPSRADVPSPGVEASGIAQAVVRRPVVRPVVVSSAIASVGLSSPTGGTLLPFAIGQGFRQGDVPSGSAVAAGIPDFQFSVRNRWPDGSARFAVLAGRVTLAANVATTLKLTRTTASTATALTVADLKASGASAAIAYGTYGTVTWTGADWDAPFMALVTGPQMSSWRYRKPIGSDAHLVGWLEVRLYKGGAVEVVPWIENGYLRVASPGARSGTASFTLNGTQRFSQSLTLLNHQRAVLASGTTLTHWTITPPQVTPRHDTAYLMATKLVPNYRGVTPVNSPLYGRLPTSYTPLMQASYSPAMGMAGYHLSIGLLPEWDAAFFTTGADPRALRGVLISGYAAGRFGIHFRDETTHRPPRFASYPTLVLDGSSGVQSTGGSTTNSYTPAASGGSPPQFASSHHPSMGFLAYLLSGWYYYAEESQFLATVNFLKQNDTTRKQTQGVLETTTGALTTRGAAWAMRSLAQAAAITPDGDALRDDYVASVSANIDYYHGRYVAIPNNPLGLVEPYSDYEAGDPLQSAMWMDDFFTASYAYMKDLKVFSPSLATKLDQFLAWKFVSVVGRLGGSGNDQYSYRHAAQYTLNYAPSTNSNFDAGTGPWYANWGAVARSMALPTDGEPGGALETGYPTDPTGYWGNLMPALAYAVEQGASGAADAWKRVNSASNWPLQAAGYNDDPVWGVRPRGVTP